MTRVRKPTEKTYCCKDLKLMIDNYYFLNEKEKAYDGMITYFEETDYQISVEYDMGVGAWIYIKYCPFCGKSLRAPSSNDLPQNTNNKTYDGKLIDGG